MRRKALVDYTFVDGTFVPRGTTVAVCQTVAHHNEAHYQNANSFEPWRFVRDADKEGDEASTHNQMVATSPVFLPFGHGRHAWYARHPPFPGI